MDRQPVKIADKWGGLISFGSSEVILAEAFEPFEVPSYYTERRELQRNHRMSVNITRIFFSINSEKIVNSTDLSHRNFLGVTTNMLFTLHVFILTYYSSSKT